MRAKEGGVDMLGKRIAGSYTIEAAYVMAVVFFTMMVLFDNAFHVRAETVGKFELHEQVEEERHLIENIDKGEINKKAEGQRWSLEITSPVFRPEKFMRMWSLVGDRE